MDSEDDALASLEERIHRAVDLVSTLRKERDAAVADAQKLRLELEDLSSQRKQARVRIEKMLSKKVHLSLWVRVTPGWTESDSALRELGYQREP